MTPDSEEDKLWIPNGDSRPTVEPGPTYETSAGTESGGPRATLVRPAAGQQPGAGGSRIKARAFEHARALVNALLV
jgi:hypothetical protein